MEDEAEVKSLPPPPAPPIQVILPPKSGGEEPDPAATAATAAAATVLATDPQKIEADSVAGIAGTDPKDASQNPEEAATPAPIIPPCIPRIIPPPTEREIRLRKVMKPLTKKCIPDTEPRFISDSKYKAPPRLGYRNGGERDDIIRRSSKLVFTMPKVRDPSVTEGLRREKMIHKLIKYMKKSWRIRVDPRQAERDLVYRTIEGVHTKHPDNYEELLQEREELIEKRGESSKQQGFFCGYDANYPSIYEPELDTPMLVFNNLAPDLKISPARWLKMKALKEELKRKRDAFLPRTPHHRSKRPNFARGKLFKDPGGMNEVDNCVKIGERFRQLCKGNRWYAKVLEDWQHGGEDQNSNNNFGAPRVSLEATADPDVATAHDALMAEIVNLPTKEETARPISRGGAGPAGAVAAGAATAPGGGEVGVEDKPDNAIGRSFRLANLEEVKVEEPKRLSSTDNIITTTNDRRESMLDGKKYQREMLETEYMILAIYDLVKSILNIKVKQLKSNLPLPDQVVKQLRDHSPESRKPAAVVALESGVVKRRGRGPAQSAATVTSTKSKLPVIQDTEVSDEEACIELEKAIEASKEHSDDEEEEMPSKSLRETMAELDPYHIHPADIIKPRKHRSSHRILEEIKRVHSLQEKMANRKQQLTAVAKIQSLAESPDHAAQRLARNAATYGRLFERRQRPKAPVWHHIHIDEYVTKYASKKGEHTLAKDPTNLTETDAEEIVEMAIRKREMLPSSRRWPDSDDIPTPTFPFARSPRRVGSEEIAKRDLLTSMPNVDDVPGTPIKRLYKLAGIRTTEKQTFNMMMDMKNQFRAVEKKVRLHCENEVWKMEIDTVRRYKSKLPAIYPDPIYEWCIAMMRGAVKAAGEEDEEDGNLFKRNETGGVRRQAMWYRKLKEECTSSGAIRHSGCQQALEKLLKYCDIDIKSKPQLVSRFALLIVSLPTTELGSRYWQNAIQFLLEHFFNAPKEVLLEWLQYRSLPLVTVA